MHIMVAGKQVETGDALKVYVADGLETMARKYFDDALEANVTFHRSRGLFGCDINLHAGRGVSYRAEGEGEDAHRAFQDAVTHVAKQLRRHRRRINEHARCEAGVRKPDVADAGEIGLVELPALRM
ncbi:ribosome hibernation-promoting factor, HPF/YfiA family [Roseomonas elaeocarpi]|uniref:Ribosome hibernation-promoting factor, HPF/YfiA family n=1 Tax=Roseomonas elaeocarpi TaxID=907779 RepID=A0ABV6JUQ0_9PROT